MENIKEYDLIHNGLYMIDKKVARFNVHNHFFYSQDGNIMGFLTRMLRSYALACHVSEKKADRLGMESKNHHIYPIPITKDILEKNGWEYFPKEENPKGYAFYYIDDLEYNVSASIYDKYFDCQICNNHSLLSHLHIHYVHEIQHALHLCGLNDLADNIKI